MILLKPLLFCVFSVAALATPPNERALQIALSSKTQERLHRELVERVKKIQPDGEIITEALKTQTLQILNSKFDFTIKKQRENEYNLMNKLDIYLSPLPKSTSLIRKAKGQRSIFPRRKPMSFRAAPGATWNGHHAYPGGLVFHTYTIVSSNEAMAKRYATAYGLELNRDLLVIAAIWHDAAKTWTITWNKDGSCTRDEGVLAGAGAHHVLAIAEALYRGHAPQVAIAIAGAHDPMTEGNPGFEKVIGYLIASATLANKPLSHVGVLMSVQRKYSLSRFPSLAALINNQGDGDWTLTHQAIQIARPAVLKILEDRGERELNWTANELFSKKGALPAYYALSTQSFDGLRAWVAENLIP